MKKVTCTAVQGPADCNHIFEVENFEGFMTQAKEHFGGKHADMVKDASEEDKAKWVAMAKGIVEGTPDEA